MEFTMLHVDEIEADVECLMCARVIGQLSGHRWRVGTGPKSARIIANLTMYVDNEPGARPRPVRAREPFRCPLCGGQGFVGEIMVRTLIEKVPNSVCPIHLQPKTGPGRPATGCRCNLRYLAA
jgi:hypothetical protein